ncbi:hypothetical protein CEXT_390041 [Caerostris extrusa]|uniref:Uncharacterized protein n=1 Tax=Caerostris extrusa TaxID=172846 RepID=A0AAV4XYF9_CAEEX|nr:hypothetical protein CEXT_390041 [Caerostris extrusa]
MDEIKILLGTLEVKRVPLFKLPIHPGLLRPTPYPTRPLILWHKWLNVDSLIRWQRHAIRLSEAAVHSSFIFLLLLLMSFLQATCIGYYGY